MPKPSRARARSREEVEEGSGFLLGFPRKDFVALTAALFISLFIAVNALFLQKGMHPAPMLLGKPVRVVPIERSVQQPFERTNSIVMPRPKPLNDATKPDTAPPRARAEIIADIQRELSRRRFYDGPADGVYGPKTEAAIRDFEQAAGSKAGADPNEAMLQSIQRAPVKVAAAPSNDAPRPPDPIAEMLSPSKRVVTVQRVLAEYGYGQLKPTGLVDQETQAAIEQFERSRRLPITGQISPRLMRELSALTGRSLE